MRVLIIVCLPASICASNPRFFCERFILPVNKYGLQRCSNQFSICQHMLFRQDFCRNPWALLACRRQLLRPWQSSPLIVSLPPPTSPCKRRFIQYASQQIIHNFCPSVAQMATSSNRPSMWYYHSNLPFVLPGASDFHPLQRKADIRKAPGRRADGCTCLSSSSGKCIARTASLCPIKRCDAVQLRQYFEFFIFKTIHRRMNEFGRSLQPQVHEKRTKTRCRSCR